ncbi:uncharacterized protein B0I36DRAFT_62466 [Microdochium trichocladiopsis]|uniref:Uncharacterized protein n=1 Tax=Microdochium trichocladiopsis TaxID=1682393 RepID=A0A9P8YFV4_9PEZI|nr:uncharacterized protein B0I36DRAFT_62466 [Microdochium trichocladiopsis]KAH7037163.1 hypothetical protein B0I36DRAFT_62466 [Microdochium trichocladiopsis]
MALSPCLPFGNMPCCAGGGGGGGRPSSKSPRGPPANQLRGGGGGNEQTCTTTCCFLSPWAARAPAKDKKKALHPGELQEGAVRPSKRNKTKSSFSPAGRTYVQVLSLKHDSANQDVRDISNRVFGKLVYSRSHQPVPPTRHSLCDTGGGCGRKQKTKKQKKRFKIICMSMEPGGCFALLRRKQERKKRRMLPMAPLGFH